MAVKGDPRIELPTSHKPPRPKVENLKLVISEYTTWRVAARFGVEGYRVYGSSCLEVYG